MLPVLVIKKNERDARAGSLSPKYQLVSFVRFGNELVGCAGFQKVSANSLR